jgi:hypothetical protein
MEGGSENTRECQTVNDCDIREKEFNEWHLMNECIIPFAYSGHLTPLH